MKRLLCFVLGLGISCGLLLAPWYEGQADVYKVSLSGSRFVGQTVVFADSPASFRMTFVVPEGRLHERLAELPDGAPVRVFYVRSAVSRTVTKIGHRGDGP